MSNVVGRVREYLLGLQQRIVSAFEAEDGHGQFIRDEWKKAPGEAPTAPKTPSASPSVS